MKRFVLTAVMFAGLVFSMVLLSTPRGQADDQGNDESRIQRGFAIAPVHLNLRGKDRAKVGLGSYIVNAQCVCSDCHTCPPYAPGHDPFEGGDGLVINGTNYLAGGTDFGPGPPFNPAEIISRNITPDATGKPAGLTFEQFEHVLRTGDDPDHPGRKLLVMVWPIFRNMTDHDISAIYEYLRAIPHAEPGCP
jgi:hypothetical protein